MNDLAREPAWYPSEIDGWSHTRVKSAVDSIDSGVWGEDPYDDEHSTTVLRSNEIDEGGVWRITEPARRLLSEDEKRQAQLHEEDLLLVKSSGSAAHIGKTAVVTKQIADMSCCFSNFTSRIRVARHATTSRFLWYYLNNCPGRDQLFYHGTTTTGLMNLSATTIGICRLLLPPLPEQERIEEYLDASCAAIDAAVAAKRQQIEVLDALRSSILSTTLTSGIGDVEDARGTGSLAVPRIPRAWTLKRLKSVARVRYGLGQPPAQLASGVEMIRATDLHAGHISVDRLMRVDPQDLPVDRNPYLKSGEIIVVRSGAYTGDSAIVPPELEGCVAGYDMVVTVDRASSRFVAYCLLSRYVLEGQILLMTLRAAQPHLNAEQLGSVVLALPPQRSEQDAMVAFLDRRLGEVTKVSHVIRRQIDALLSYRRSFIHECVTGQRRVTEADVKRAQAHG